MTTAVVLSDASATAQTDVRSEQANAVQEAVKPQAPVVAPKPRKSKPSTKPIEECSVGTRVCFSWAEWLKKNALGLPESVVTVTKEAARLVVYVYRNASGKAICGVLKIDDSLCKTIVRCGAVVQQGESRLREFREWNEEVGTVLSKLLARGWELQPQVKGK